VQELRFQVDGMSCPGCAESVRKAMTAVPGAGEVSVNFAERAAVVRGGGAAAGEFEAAVARAGFTLTAEVEPGSDDAGHGHGHESGAKWYVAVSGLCVLAGWALTWGSGGHAHGTFHARDSREWLALALIATGGLMAAVPVARNAWAALRRRELTADVLVMIAVIGAVSIGEYFAAAEVAFILLLGEQVEGWTLGRARSAIASLVKMAPRTARVRDGAGEREVPVSRVRPGDEVIVRPGEQIPVDGEVVQGGGAVDESLITGESVPVDKSAGATVTGGTMNAEGALVVRAMAVGADSTLARITRLVRDAQEHPAPVARICDQYARFVIPIMLGLAVVTLLVMRLGFDAAWRESLQRAVTVMIVACPCALVLATPTAVVAAVGRCARAGILFKGGAHVEAAGRVRAVVFDKTGTLTCGAPQVVDSGTEPGVDLDVVWRVAASAEWHSEHPYGRAIVTAARARGVPAEEPETTQAERGAGVVARVAGVELRVGRREWLESAGVRFASGAETAPDDGTGTPLWVARDGVALGWLRVADVVRPTAAEAVRLLEREGVREVWMVSGDRPGVVAGVARACGIAAERAAGGVSPEGKVDRVRAIARDGTVTAMVGDGVNDAPALAASGVGFAMAATGATVAHEAAHVAVMNADPRRVAFAVRMGRRMLGVVRQGIAFAVVFNVVMITLAMTGRLPMWAAALAHQGSSILVVLNAVRLLGVRPHWEERA
jgi:Cd2+/Zn2+-exporting ATPase